MDLGGGVAGDFLLLEYAGGDRLYLPVDRINLVQRYVGAEGERNRRSTSSAGSPGRRPRGRRGPAIEEMAEELLAIYAERQVHEGFAFSPPDELYREFEAAFAFEETPDQLRPSRMSLPTCRTSRPMDRLICGDVGYGKTEVAMRGAFKAVMDGKQVAVLVPTTVLAQQHLETFRERFAEYPGDRRDGLPLPHRRGAEGDPGEGRRRGRWTSSSAPTASSRRTWSSGTWGCSSSTRSSVSALPTRRS